MDQIGVFARMAPEHKVAIVQALVGRGHIVAMTGDGVNDAAASRHAHIGIAMGITGTEVTQEASTMILPTTTSPPSWVRWKRDAQSTTTW